MLRSRLSRVARGLAILALGTTLGLTLASSAHAYRVSGAGGKFGFADPDRYDPTLMLGLHLELEQRGSHLHMVPNLLYWNTDRVSNAQPNLDLYYHFEPAREITPYLGGGVGLNFWRDDRAHDGHTDIGVNLLAGFSFPDRSALRRYYLEGRLTASEIRQFAMLAGVTFGSR